MLQDRLHKDSSVTQGAVLQFLERWEVWILGGNRSDQQGSAGLQQCTKINNCAVGMCSFPLLGVMGHTLVGAAWLWQVLWWGGNYKQGRWERGCWQG